MSESATNPIKKSLGLLWFALGAVVLLVAISGVVLGHSDSFKEECGARKVSGVSLGFVKNAVCDMDFELD